MLFCPNNETLDFNWHGGVSPCFMDTVSTSVSAGFLLVFGFIQFLVYKKYGTSCVDTVNAFPKSRLYSFQQFLLIFFPILALIRFFALAYFYEEPALYGYMVSERES